MKKIPVKAISRNFKENGVSASVKENESAETQPRKSVKMNGEEKKQWRSYIEEISKKSKCLK
jgi:hypothetical protein